MKNILKRLTFKRTDLGEGISYDGSNQTITWVDIPNSKVFEYNKNKKCEIFTLGAYSSFVVKTKNKRYLSGGSEGLTLDGKFISKAIRLEDDIINDGSVHPSGKILMFGSRDCYEHFKKGSLWILGKDIRQIKMKFKVFNGPAFSKDGYTVFFTDSPKKVIYKAEFNLLQENLENISIFYRFHKKEDGFPDGMITDSKDNLWVAHWDGGKISCINPKGNLIKTLSLPFSRPTSICFKENDMYVTSARVNYNINDQYNGYTHVIKKIGSSSPQERLDNSFLKFFN